jgi:hypothetical protein
MTVVMKDKRQIRKNKTKTMKKYKNKGNIKNEKNKQTKKSRKRFLYNPNDPKKSFDVYIDKNPRDTIHIKYTTVDDVKNTIRKLEKLYKDKKYPHKRIWQVGMIMKVRLEVLQDKKPKEYHLAKKYFHFLSERTRMNESDRYMATFKI